MSNNDNKFTIADLQKWVEEGLISPEQGTSIRSYIESSGSVQEQSMGIPEQRKGLNFISLAYYFGSFISWVFPAHKQNPRPPTSGYPAESMWGKPQTVSRELRIKNKFI